MTSQSGNLASPSQDDNGLDWTVSILVKGTAGPVERLGTLQTLICADCTPRHKYSHVLVNIELSFFFSFIHFLFSCGLSTHNKHDDDDECNLQWRAQTMSHIVESCPFTILNGGYTLQMLLLLLLDCLVAQLWILIAYARRGSLCMVWIRIAGEYSAFVSLDCYTYLSIINCWTLFVNIWSLTWLRDMFYALVCVLWIELEDRLIA